MKHMSDITSAPVNLGTMQAIAGEITKQEEALDGQKIQVLNRASAKLKDLEEETRYMQEQRDAVDKQRAIADTNIAQITQLRDKYQSVVDDFDITISANLKAIDSLRQSNIR